MKFFRLLYICLISFITSPFLYGMDFGMDFSDDFYFIPPSKSPQKLPTPKQTTKQVSTNTPPPLSKSNIIESTDNSENTPSSSYQKELERIELTRKLQVMKNDLAKFTSPKNIRLQELEQSAKKLRENLNSLTSPLFGAIPEQSSELKEKISQALNQYNEKTRVLNTYLIPWIASTEPIKRIPMEKLSDIVIDTTTPMLASPFLRHPIAEAFVTINRAIAYNNQEFIIQAMHNFKDTYRNFGLTSTDFFQIENAVSLKQYLFKTYLWNLSNRTFPETLAEISNCLPFLFNVIAYQQQQQNLNKKSESQTDNDKRLQLIDLIQADLLTILNFLQANNILNKNIDLIKDILLRTQLNHITQQACLLLLNKIGKFYSEIKSDFAITIIDDIAAYYFESLEKQESQEQKDALMSRIIKLLNSVPLLEPLFSETLQISAIADDELEDYLEKVTLLELNAHPSPSIQQKLKVIEADIKKEVYERSARARIEAEKAQQETIEFERLETEQPAEEFEKELDEWFKTTEAALVESTAIHTIGKTASRSPAEVTRTDLNALDIAATQYAKERDHQNPSIEKMYELERARLEDALVKKESLHQNYLVTLSNTDLVEKIKQSAVTLLSSHKTSNNDAPLIPINEKTLTPIFKYTDQLIKNKAATGKDGVIVANHFIDIAKTIDVLRKIAHVLDPQDHKHKKDINQRIQWLMYIVNHRDKDELIQQIKERKGRFNRQEKTIIKDIINNYYFSSHAGSYVEPLFTAKNSVLAAIETMEAPQNTEQTSTMPIITDDQLKLPAGQILSQESIGSPLEPGNNSSEQILPGLTEEQPQPIFDIELQKNQPPAPQTEQKQMNQAPSLWENIINAIQSWFKGLFW